MDQHVKLSRKLKKRFSIYILLFVALCECNNEQKSLYMSLLIKVVGNLFSEKIIHDLIESHNFLKFGKKR